MVTVLSTPRQALNLLRTGADANRRPRATRYRRSQRKALINRSDNHDRAFLERLEAMHDVAIEPYHLAG
jgi:hypothetical protein